MIAATQTADEDEVTSLYLTEEKFKNR